MQAYAFEGYWEDIGTIGAFYRSQLALLEKSPAFSFHGIKAPVFSASRALPPSTLIVCLLPLLQGSGSFCWGWCCCAVRLR